MRRIEEVADRRIEWRQPSAMKMNYELLADDEVVATLRFRSMFGSFATAEGGDGCWTFKRQGFWRTRVTVRVCEQESDLAVFHNNTWRGGGMLEMADGRRFLATTNFWQTRFEFTDENEEPLIRYHIGGAFRMNATVELLPASQHVPETSLMVALGWYLAVMMHQDAAAASAAT
jgi:hypothetical protein